MVKRLEYMKENLVSCVQGQMGDLASVDAKEMGEVVDMIKDLSEAIYYCTITEAMQGNSEKEKHYRDMDRDSGRMYYNPSIGDSRNYPIDIRDYREGRSPITRKMYMEHKELHHGKEVQMQELDKYM